MLVAAGGRAPVLRAEGACTRELVRALSRERPGQPIETSGTLDGDDLSVRLGRSGSAWRLGVEGADGAQRLERALQGRHCSEVADAAAVIVERYLASISWRGGDASLQPLKAPEPRAEPAPWPVLPQHPRADEPKQRPPPAATASPASAPTPATAPSTTPPLVPALSADSPAPAPPPVVAAADPAPAAPPAAVAPVTLVARGDESTSRWLSGAEVALGPAVSLGNDQLLPAASVEAAVRIRDLVRASIWFGSTLPQSQPFTVTETVAGNPVPVASGQVAMQFDFLYLSAAACHSFGRIEACGGAAGGAAMAYASASGQVFGASGGVLAPAVLGVVGRVAYVWPSGPEISLQALGGFPLTRPTYQIDGSDVATVPAAEAVAALHLGWAFQ